MKKNFWAVATLAVLLTYGTSSCTSKSENASTQLNQTIQLSEEADNPLELLKVGNERFVSGNLLHNHQDVERIKELVEGQHPKAVVITCSDSRVPPEIIFDQGLGDIFTIRTAGNVMSDYEEGSVEYAVEHLHTQLVVVMGHQGCGAIHAMLEHLDGGRHHAEAHQVNHTGEAPDHISSIIHALESEEEVADALNDQYDRTNAMVRANVLHGVRQLRQSEPILSKLHDNGEIKVVGAIYHLDTGKVEFLDI